MEVLVVPVEGEHPDAEVVRKTACLPGERERLLREGQVLRAAAERGVSGLPVVVAQPSPDAAEPCLITRAVVGPSLAAVPPLPIVEVAGVVAEVARHLAGLHEAGLVHGAVEPSHVVLDGAGSVIMVGLGDGGSSGAAGASAVPLDPAADVAGWGRLVTHLLDGSASGEAEPLDALRRTLPARGYRRGRRQPTAAARPDEDGRRVLAALADQAQDPDPARRPSARSLAAAVSHRVPDALVPGTTSAATPSPVPAPVPASGLLDRLAAHVLTSQPSPAADAGAPEPVDDAPAPPAAGEPSGRPRRRRRRVEGRRPPPADEATTAGPPEGAPREQAGEPEVLVAAPTVRSRPATRPPLRRGRPSRLVAGALGAAVLLGATAAVAHLRRPGRAARAVAAAAPRPACPPRPQPAADVDGDGCEESVRWAGGVLEVGVARFALGAPGDAWALGDWDCDGRRTPALLHEGALEVFDGWPGPGAELRGRRVAAAPGASGLAVVPGADGCDRPAISRPGADALVVDPRGLP